MSLLGWESFDGVTQRGAGHGCVVLSEEALQGAQVFLACFAEHPACSFMDKIFGIGEENFGEREGVF